MGEVSKIQEHGFQHVLNNALFSGFVSGPVTTDSCFAPRRRGDTPGRIQGAPNLLCGNFSVEFEIF